MVEAVEGLEWMHIFWNKGAMLKGSRFHNDVTDPPCSGWQHAFVMRGERHSTIFCPYSMTSYSVTEDSMELVCAEEPDRFDLDFVVDLINRNWREAQGFGWNRAYDVAALVLRKLGAPVPEQLIRGGEEDTRKKGGKLAGDALLKIVKRDSKRGKFLAWFLEEDSRSVREAMAEFSMSRSNALSYLHMLNKDHGIGYELVGDSATVSLPGVCVDPFSEEEEEEEEDDGDDAWLD